MTDRIDEQLGASRHTGAPLLADLSSALDGLVAEVEAGGLRRLDDGELVGFIAAFEQLRNRLSLVDYQLVAAVDASTVADELVTGSTAKVLSRVARISGLEASRRVRAAEALVMRPSMTGAACPAKHPALACAVSSGRVPVESTQVAVRCLRRLERRFFASPDQLTFADTHLASAAVAFGPEQVRHVAAKIQDVLFPDGCLADEHEVAEARDLTLTPKADGSWLVEGRLTGLCGAAFSAAISSLAAPFPAPDGSADPRTARQRRHDALHTLSTMALRSGGLPRSGGVPASIIITIDSTHLVAGTGHGTTADGGILYVAEIMRLADEAELLPTLITQGFTNGGMQLNLGRTRRCATEYQTKALIARDGGCTFPHCSAPPAWCDRHHIIAWRHDGPTNIDNLTLLCGYHHSYVEQHHWKGQMINGLPHWIPPRWIDPTQTPLLHDRISSRLVIGMSA